MTNTNKTLKEDIEEQLWRFAKYCNGLSPWKLNDPKDPLVEGAVQDSAQQLIQLFTLYSNEARLDELKRLHTDLRLVVDNHGVLTLRDRIFNRIKELSAERGDEV